MTSFYWNPLSRNAFSMKQRLFATLICACLGTGLAYAEPPAAADEDDSASVVAPGRLPKIELTPQLLHQFLVAEFAGHRGQMALAVSAYQDLVVKTRDPRVARRAAEIALYAHQYNAALDDARIWVEADPDSEPARQMLASLLAASGRSEELATQVAKMLSSAGPGPALGNALLRLNSVFSRSPDKASVQRLIDQVTAPYLGVAEAHFARAIAAYEARDPQSAGSEIDRALALRPDWEQAALVRAQIAPRGPEMLEGLRSFVVANPKAMDARLAYARALVSEKRYEDARREFNSILAVSAENPDVIYAIAVLSLQLNEPGLAEGHLKRLVDLGYSEADSARLYLGQIAEERKQ